jgi:hypothetical protein
MGVAVDGATAFAWFLREARIVALAVAEEYLGCSLAWIAVRPSIAGFSVRLPTRVAVLI